MIGLVNKHNGEIVELDLSSGFFGLCCKRVVVPGARSGPSNGSAVRTELRLPSATFSLVMMIARI